MVPSPTELTYFYEVAIESNLSRAANKLFMSQPSLSLAIKRLEQTVGENLFIRHKHGMTLTKAGKSLLRHVKPLLQYWENTKLKVIESHHSLRGEVIIGCPPTIGYHLHRCISELLQENLQLSFQLRFDKSLKITEEVIHSRIDLGIVANPLEHPDLVMRQINTSEMTFWSDKSSSRTRDTKLDNLIIICDPELQQTQLLLKKWNNCKLAKARIISINNLEVIAHLTANGCGIGILPSCFVQSIYMDTLSRVPNAPAQTSQVYLIYRQENRELKAIQTVAAALKKVMW